MSDEPKEPEGVVERNQGEAGGDEAFWGAVVPRIIGSIEHHLGPGDLAQLRRMRVDQPGCPAFWKIVSEYLAGALPLGELARCLAEERWATILRTFAELSGMNSPRTDLGTALAKAEFSEVRFTRLLRARNGMLDDAVRGASRILASKGQASRLVDFAALVLLQDDPGGERVRRRLARSYYAKPKTRS